jgi:lysophospholipase L1-like esterase
MTPEKELLYRINAQGFRDRERVRPKPSGMYRILVLGDSVTFGFGVQPEESFTRLLEAELKERVPEAGIESSTSE